MENYYIIPAKKVEDRLEYLIDKGMSERVSAIENILDYSKTITLDDGNILLKAIDATVKQKGFSAFMKDESFKTGYTSGYQQALRDLKDNI